MNKNFPLCTSWAILRPVQSSVEWLSDPSSGGKAAMREADQSGASNREIRNEWSCNSAPPLWLHGLCSGDLTLIVVCTGKVSHNTMILLWVQCYLKQLLCYMFQPKEEAIFWWDNKTMWSNSPVWERCKLTVIVLSVAQYVWQCFGTKTFARKRSRGFRTSVSTE
jgi:hypothetical protein